MNINRSRGATQINGSETIDRLQVNSGDGDDDVDVDASVLGLIGVAVDFGLGES